MRDVSAIDDDLRCERAILAFERRSGEKTSAVLDTKARIDDLLDERAQCSTRQPEPA